MISSFKQTTWYTSTMILANICFVTPLLGTISLLAYTTK